MVFQSFTLGRKDDGNHNLYSIFIFIFNKIQILLKEYI